VSDFTWMQVVDAGARSLSTGGDSVTNNAIVERLRVIYGDIKRNAGEEGGWSKHFEAIRIAADRIVILADAVRGNLECIRRLAAERNAAREERDELLSLIKKLEWERDKARQECCTAAVSQPFGSGSTHYNCGDVIKEANRRGWDCFGGTHT